MILTLSRLSDSVQARRGLYFKDRLYILALKQARMLILGKCVLLGVKNTIYKHCHA